MQLYSELYNCYYDIMHDILSSGQAFSGSELEVLISHDGFGETALYFMPKILSGEWALLKKEGDCYLSSLDHTSPFVLSLLQKRWIKAILNDERIQLFLSGEQLEHLSESLSGIEPLFKQSDFCIYDRFANGDNYSDPAYRAHFRTILAALKSGQYLNIEFESHRKKRVHHHYLPCKLEYSIRNNCFRLLALEEPRRKKQKDFFTINLSRISSIKETGRYAQKRPDIDSFIKKQYNPEPVTLMIKNERNALERAMLQFANYKKNTKKIGENLYQCEIFYSRGNETELLIEVLSFGPMIRVVGNEHFLTMLKERLQRQKELIGK